MKCKIVGPLLIDVVCAILTWCVGGGRGSKKPEDQGKIRQAM